MKNTEKRSMASPLHDLTSFFPFRELVAWTEEKHDVRYCSTSPGEARHWTPPENALDRRKTPQYRPLRTALRPFGFGAEKGIFLPLFLVVWVLNSFGSVCCTLCSHVWSFSSCFHFTWFLFYGFNHVFSFSFTIFHVMLFFVAEIMHLF